MGQSLTLVNIAQQKSVHLFEANLSLKSEDEALLILSRTRIVIKCQRLTSKINYKITNNDFVVLI